MTISFLLLIPFYIYSGPFLKACGQNNDVSKLTGVFILYYMPGIYFMALIDIDKILLMNLDKTNYAMGC